MDNASIKHYFDLETWVKIETRAKREEKKPEEVAVFILAERVGLIHRAAKSK